jgi:hypothetical protein
VVVMVSELGEWMRSTDLHTVARHRAKRVSDLGEDGQGGQPEKRRLHPSHERLL